MHSTFWVLGGVGVVGGWCVVGGGLGKVGWLGSVWVRSVGLSWAGFVELSSVGWVPAIVQFSRITSTSITPANLLQ